MQPSPTSENSAPESAMPAGQAMMQMVSGVWLAPSIGAAARHSIPDLLVSGPKNADELARETGLHAPSLFRLLRALAGVGIFTQDEENRFGLTPLSETLRSDAPASLRDLTILMCHESHWRAWGNLDHALQTGEPAFNNAFGTDFFTHAEAQPDTQEVFSRAMTSLSLSVHVAAAQSYDFSDLQTLMDVGGGYGTLLSAICARTPNLRGLLFDLPHVVAGAGPVLSKWGVQERITPVGGDFFQPIASEISQQVDACILSTVIHDWDDERSVKILKNCHGATKVGGKLLLVEMVIPEGAEPSLSKLSDLNMLVMTPGGRERTEAQFRALFAEAGYELTRVVPTPSPASIIEGVRQD